MKELPVQWEKDDGREVPTCPSCGDWIFNTKRCELCGQKLKKDKKLEEWFTEVPEIKHMDCFLCGGKDTYEYTESKYNGHKHGKCTKCGAVIVE